MDKRLDYDELAKKLNSLKYSCKDSENYISNSPCGFCGQDCVSINDAFLHVGECYYCGNTNLMETCDRCMELFVASNLKNGFCPSCYDYIEKQ